MGTPENLTLGHVLSFMYMTFAHCTDSELSQEETNKICIIIDGWGNVDTELTLRESLDWFLSFETKKERNHELFQYIPVIKENITADEGRRIIEELVAIAKADGKYDELEKSVATNIAKALEIENPNV